MFPPSIDPQVPHAAIFVIALGVFDHLFVYYILIPVFVQCTSSSSLIVLSYVDKIIIRIRGTLSSYAIRMKLPFECLGTIPDLMHTRHDKRERTCNNSFVQVSAIVTHFSISDIGEPN